MATAGHEAKFIASKEGASRQEWQEASRSELRDSILPTYAGEKMPTRLVGEKVYEISWTKLKGHCDGSGWVGTYRNAAGKPKDLDTHEVPAYGFAIALGDVIAIDCDIEDSETAEVALSCLMDAAGLDVAPRRIRNGSARWAAFVAIDGVKTPLPNGIGKVEGKGDIELKGRDHLLVAAGIHPSGANYRWIDGPCCSVIHLSAEQWTKYLGLSVERLGVEWRDVGKMSSGSLLSGHEEGFLTTYDAEFDSNGDSLAKWLTENGHIHAKRGSVLDFVSCPWSGSHGTDTDGTATTSYFCGIGGRRSGFHCFHAHCSGHGIGDLEAWAESEGWENPRKAAQKAKEEAFERLLPSQPAPIQQSPMVAKVESAAEPPCDALGDFYAAFLRTRKKKNELGEVVEVQEVEFSTTSLTAFMASAPLCGFEIRHDSFFGEVYVRRQGAEDWQVWDEFVTVNELQMAAESVFMKNMVSKAGDFQRTLQVVARMPGHARDSGIDAIESLPKWDGKVRLRTWLRDFAGVADNEGTKALAAYIVRAMVARLSCLQTDGVKADIIPIFYGEQKKKKSLLVKALSILGPDGFTDEVRFDADAVDTLRLTLGKCVVEIGELGGLKGDRKTRDDIKQWCTKTKDRMTQKYEKQAKDYPRRWLPIITTNERQILRDPTGDRRFAPVHIAQTNEVDLEGLTAALPQIFAEAKAMNASNGGDMKDAQLEVEKHLHVLHADFQDPDPWESKVMEWAAFRGYVPFTATQVLTDADGIGMPIEKVGRKDANRVADILRKNGFISGKDGWTRR